MYGICPYVYHQDQPNLVKYTIPGSYYGIYIYTRIFNKLILLHTAEVPSQANHSLLSSHSKVPP